MTLEEYLRLIFAALTALGGGYGLAKLLSVKKTNESIEAATGKTGVEATAIFSDSVLKMLKNAQESADKSRRLAENAFAEAQRCQEELAFLRRWIIEQGLTPPKREISTNG